MCRVTMIIRFGQATSTLLDPGGGSPITGPMGEEIAKGGKCFEGAEELLSVFLGYPKGWAWWTLQQG